jgi:uncharacterized protein YbjT (DUF2867 family)
MTFAIAGVSGHTGQVAAEALLGRGKSVRVIVRDAAKGAVWKQRGAEVAVADLTDAKALAAALRGIEGVYLLNPPNMAAPDFRAFQDQVSEAALAAVREAKVPHVVYLSSIGAQLPAGTGPIAGLHHTEKLLAQIPATVVSFLRAGYFVNNIADSFGAAKEAGILPVFFPAGLAIPMTTTGDIGRLAAELLLDPPASNRVVELGTPRTHEEIARVLSKLLKKPVAVQPAPVDAVASTLRGFGLPADIAQKYQEMTAAIIDGRVKFEGHHRHVDSTEPLELVIASLLG